MDRQTSATDQQAYAAGAPVSTASPGAGPGRVRYAPVIGKGPLPQGPADGAGPLVPEPAAGVPGAFPQAPSPLSSLADGASGDTTDLAVPGPTTVGFTDSGHAVPEFLAGAAQLTQLLVAEFPHASLPEQSLGETVGAAQALVQAAQSLLTRATHEAMSRGLPAQSGHSVPDWITTWAPMIDRPEALATARVAGTMDDDLLGTLGAKITDGTTRVARVNIVARFAREMAPIADAESLKAIMTTLTDHVESLGTRSLSTAVKRAKAVLKPAPDDDEAEAKQAGKRLLRRTGTTAGLAEWQLLLDEEAEAILQAALDPLTKPRPAADQHGLQRTDTRTASQRRGDALVEILTRAAATDASDAPTCGAGRIQVTADLEALKGEVPGGGTDEHGHRLSPGAIRRLACDADLYPVVLGGPSEPLDVGRVKRLFTPAQRRAVYLRDRHCSFPGCTVPPAWCQIHHVLHWVFGGKTDLLNAAALCQRHHTVVHRYGYTATVTETEVIWHIPRPFTATGFG
ncbi:HNH endonuclease signature motif containing protein [Ornithinimicrobium murale]|uniref:HNH endonuclease signature motif containing protein n=1 Tax=Ornithinimicrobium murale TaxID=1050153 RepID=UPI0013B44406|nr:HNH endonuclease signature motif containing protein [Ornithinimicrobium murale]